MSGASSAFPFLFQGMEYDVPSGLYHAGNNYYSPQLTRPVSEVGPTPGRTSGNPSSPGDVPGFGGGGGSFAWTYNNLQPQLSASIAAGAGAAGLTAGAAALVSTLGLDIGLTASAAGPVGAVVGALTGLGFLFADLFGGVPPTASWGWNNSQGRPMWSIRRQQAEIRPWRVELFAWSTSPFPAQTTADLATKEGPLNGTP
jgi:hypothetical protein